MSDRSLSRLGKYGALVLACLILFSPCVHAQTNAPDPRQDSSEVQGEAPEDATDPKRWYAAHLVAFQEEKWLPEEGLEFESRDGMFALAIRLRAQFLYQIVLPEDPNTGAREDLEQNLVIRRARIVFGGNMWGRKTEYKVELAVAPNDLGMEHLPGTDNPPITNNDNYISRSLLLDWYMQWKQIDALNFRLGQYKVPYSRDRVISSGNLQFVDRTILNQEFNLDRDIGFDFRSKNWFGWDKRLRYYAGVYNGEGHSAYELRNFALMYLGRVEILPFGDFDDYSQADLDRISKPGVSIGAAYARIQDAAGSRGILGERFDDGGTTDYNNVTTDLMFKYRGLSVDYAFFWRRGRRDPGDAVDEVSGEPIAATPARNGWGNGVQAGYLLPKIDLELAGRYSAIRGHNTSSSLRDANEVGMAISYYFAQHAYKLQADYLHYWGPGVNDSGRLFTDGRDDFRLQLQASF